MKHGKMKPNNNRPAEHDKSSGHRPPGSSLYTRATSGSSGSPGGVVHTRGQQQNIGKYMSKVILKKNQK